MVKLSQPLFDVLSNQKKAKATDPVRQPYDRRVFSTPCTSGSLISSEAARIPTAAGL